MKEETIGGEKMKKKILIKVDHIVKCFKKSKKQDLLVLDNIKFDVHEGEIIALLGKTGSGKSTLLRIIAGLTQPNSGKVVYQGQPILRPVPGLSMVFQQFSLLPWLTVLENVELGLEAQNVPKKTRRQRALAAIDIVGLDGFESAYPKELSGGMSQRVGIARALVVEPEVLLMDEPFSSLDVLTADNLRRDLTDIFQQKKTKLKSIILVTHNIEEAALLADRVLIFSYNPGTVKTEINVELSHPRDAIEKEFSALVDEIYDGMASSADKQIRYRTIGLGHRLPKVQISEIMGFVETLASAEFESKGDLPDLAEELHLQVDDMFRIMEVLEILHFAYLAEGDIILNPVGKQLADADILTRKKIFSAHLMNYVPLARYIRKVLDERPSHEASEERFLRELEDYLSEQVAQEVLEVIIDWGRYAEIFAYDYDTGILSLENPT